MLRNCTKLDQAQRIRMWWWFPGGGGWWLGRWCLCSWGLAWCLLLCWCSTCGCPSHANNWILQLGTQELGPRGPRGNTFSRTVETSGLIGVGQFPGRTFDRCRVPGWYLAGIGACAVRCWLNWFTSFLPLVCVQQLHKGSASSNLILNTCILVNELSFVQKFA